MKSIKNEVDLNNASEYPRLMELDTGEEEFEGDVYLFIGWERGVLIHAGSLSTRSVGYESDNFAMKAFKDYAGSITLSNE